MSLLSFKYFTAGDLFIYSFTSIRFYTFANCIKLLNNAYICTTYTLIKPDEFWFSLLFLSFFFFLVYIDLTINLIGHELMSHASRAHAIGDICRFGEYVNA